MKKNEPIFKEIDEPKNAQTYADVRSISSAKMVYKKDAGTLPTKDGNLPRQVPGR